MCIHINRENLVGSRLQIRSPHFRQAEALDACLEGGCGYSGYSDIVNKGTCLLLFFF